jgi:hypothetical protein
LNNFEGYGGYGKESAIEKSVATVLPIPSEDKESTPGDPTIP